MATVDYGLGPREIRCTAYTMAIYEQEFAECRYPHVTGDLISDVLGRQTAKADDVPLTRDEDGELMITLDYTRCVWPVEMRAMWAMMRTAEEIAQAHDRECEPVPSYREFERSLLEVEPDMSSVYHAVDNELMRGLFRSGAAASGKTSEWEA